MVTKYPFSVRDDLIAAGPAECARILLSATVARLFSRRLHNARDFARHRLGARLLYRSGLKNDVKRFCGLAAERIDLKLAETRMLWMAEYASLQNLVRRVVPSLTKPSAHPARQPPTHPADGRIYRPLRPAVRRLKDRGVVFVLGVAPNSCGRPDGAFRLDLDARTVVARRIVSTSPWTTRSSCATFGREPQPTVTLLSLFYGFSNDRGFEQSILYNFDRFGAWKRLAMCSDFYTRSTIASTSPSRSSPSTWGSRIPDPHPGCRRAGRPGDRGPAGMGHRVARSSRGVPAPADRPSVDDRGRRDLTVD
jgi:hypothetical protein